MISPLQANPIQVIQGVPYFDLIVLVVLFLAAVAWWYFRTSVQGQPVLVDWIYRNGSAVRLRAKEDLQGVFLTIQNLKGKVVSTIKKRGLPLEIVDISHLKENRYYIIPTDQKRKVWKKGD